MRIAARRITWALALFTLLAATPVAARVLAPAGTVTIHPQVSSRYLPLARDIRVYLPPGYAQSSASYPVLYMHDGQNLFDRRTAAFGMEWEIDETLDRMIPAGELPAMIVVGVDNTRDRMDEYTWLPGTYEGKRTGGRGSDYARFLVTELKPLIDRTYRTRPEREHTAVMGASLGGLINLYLGHHYPGIFSRIGIMSPSLFWAGHAANDVLREYPGGQRLWLDIGDQEGDGEECVPDTEAARDRLVARGYRSGIDLGFMIDPGALHNEQAWARRTPTALRFLFGK